MGIPPTIEVANLGMADSLILMVMALVVFGPRRLPQIGRQIGKLMYEFRKASNDFKFQMEEELRNAEEADRRKKEEEARQSQLAANPPAQIEATVPASTETSDTADISYPDNIGGYDQGTEPQSQAETPYPSIQPPATGEPIPAVWPATATYDPEDPQNPVDPIAVPDVAAATSVESGPEAGSAKDGTPTALEKQVPVEKENAVVEAPAKPAVEDTHKISESAAHNG
jgi:sec-independent protein translocase protein TatB